MSGHKCHCGKPATWFVRVVPMHEVVLAEGNLPEIILDAQSVDLWATCDEHIAEAAHGLINRNEMDEAVLVLRPEQGDADS